MTKRKDWIIGQRRGLLLVMSHDDPKYDTGRHLMVIAKCSCGDIRSYRLDNITGTPRPSCPICAAAKKLGNQYHLRRKPKNKAVTNTPIPIEIRVVNAETTQGSANPNPIDERVPPQKAVLCLHRFHLLGDEIAEGLNLARTHCPVCRTFPKDYDKALARLKLAWEGEMKRANAGMDRGRAFTDLETEATARRKASHPNAVDLGRVGKNIFYKGTTSHVEKIDSAHQRDEEMGGKKRTPAGRDGVIKNDAGRIIGREKSIPAYQDSKVDANYDDDYNDDHDSLDGLPPVHFERQLSGLTENPDDRELLSFHEILEEVYKDDAVENAEEFNWWTRFKRIYHDEFKRPLRGVGKKKIERWFETVGSEETLVQEFFHWVRGRGVAELEKPLVHFTKYLQGQYDGIF